MARATRSSANLEKSDIPALPRASSKKRKRLSNAANDDHPISKLPRIDTTQPDTQAAAHSVLHDADATSILDILEVADSQGLLDRVFPLPPDAPTHGSFSLRVLLKQPTQHPLWVLRAAVQNLFPLSSSHPRSRPSDTAIQQHRFCKVALSLLEQASRNVIRIPPSATTILDSDPAETQDSPSPDGESSDIAKVPPYKRYALMQHLPSGDYWTSLNADIHNSTKQLMDLSLGNADLVAVFPTPSKSGSAPSVPTLGSYHANKVTTSMNQVTEQRRVSSGTFLDYGSWASFAPTFDHDGQAVGRSELGELLYYQQQKRRKAWEHLRVQGRDEEIVELKDGAQDNIPGPEKGRPEPIDIDAELEGLLPPHLVKSLKDALKCLDLENAVAELVERNSEALRRLEELQKNRLLNADGGSSRAEEGSEEWEIAHAILDTLTVLASLRPQSTEAKVGSIVPSAAVLHKLQLTLARRTKEGWHGTLPPTKPTALRDDATVKIRAGSIISATAATNTPTATTTAAPSTPYAGYSYAYGQQAYRPSTAATPYTPYKQGQYYQTPYLASAAGAQNYYGQQTYAGGASGQQPYAAYSAWYSQYSAPAANANTAAPASAASSGRGTPQPAGSAAATVPSTYGGFFAAAATPPSGVARSPAVANTVLSNKPGTPSTTWTSYPAGQQPAFTGQLRQGQQMGYYGGQTSQQTPT